MKAFKRLSVAVVAVLCALGVSAQYYQLANQLPGLISPALSGSGRYKGFVELSGVAGLGDNRANFVGISTSQGYQYSSWFFMGVGIGLDVAMAKHDDSDSGLPPEELPGFYRRESSDTKVMLPLFSDFRFNIGGAGGGASAFIDLKIGAAWFLGNSYLALDNARMGRGAQFYLKPTLGVRVPVSKNNPDQAFVFGLTYQLLTSNNNYSWTGNSVTLNSIGATIGFEW